MMQVDLQIDSVTTANKKQSKNITYINPTATNAQLKTLAQTLNALTTNTYTDAQRIAENSVDSDSGAKIEPTLSVDSSGTIAYDGDGSLFVKIDSNGFGRINSSNLIEAKSDSGWMNTFSGTVYATEGTNYAAKSTEFTVG